MTSFPPEWNLAYLALNALLLPGWALLILAPRSALTRRLVHSFVYPLAIGAIYIVSLSAAIFFGYSAEGVGFSSIDAAAALFDHPNGVITGWSHYVLFDIFVGAWISRDMLARPLPHWAMAAFLIPTYVFGPLGLFAYACYRTLRGEGLLADNGA